MIRKATESDYINLTALSLEVWLQTYSIDGIRTENSKYVLSSFTEEHFKEILHDNKYKLFGVHRRNLSQRIYTCKF